MEDYKIRFINEYHELVNRAQFGVMAVYVNILKTRVIYEHRNLYEEVSADGEE